MKGDLLDVGSGTEFQKISLGLIPSNSSLFDPM